MTRAARATIRPYLTEYLAEIGSEIGTTDPSEVVNQIIIDHKRDRLQQQPNQPNQSPTYAQSND